MRAGPIDIFDRSLTDEHMIPLVVHDHRHPLALKIKGDLVHLLAAPLDIEIGMRKHRSIQQVAQACLEIAIHVRIAQHVLTIAIRYVDTLLKNYPILCKSPGLVSAEDV